VRCGTGGRPFASHPSASDYSSGSDPPLAGRGAPWPVVESAMMALEGAAADKCRLRRGRRRRAALGEAPAAARSVKRPIPWLLRVSPPPPRPDRICGAPRCRCNWSSVARMCGVYVCAQPPTRPPSLIVASALVRVLAVGRSAPLERRRPESERLSILSARPNKSVAQFYA
jgi:hypothetical protein